ncbi:hypothetical protein [Caudoviricetes sp.]|nr:hypothetical protein [Caudoviricetes sp.]
MAYSSLSRETDTGSGFLFVRDPLFYILISH